MQLFTLRRVKSDAFYLSEQINRFVAPLAPKEFVMAILKSHKLKVIYFICSHFYYFFTAIYFTVFYESEYLFFWDEMEKSENSD